MHRQIMEFGWIELLVIGGGIAFLGIVYIFDKWMEEEGIRIVPAPHIGYDQPTSLQGKIAAEADKQQEQVGDKKETS